MGTAMRGSDREVPPGGRPDTPQFKGRGPTPSQVAVGNELRENALRAMEELPPDYRRVLQLVQTEGRTLREAAGDLDRSYEAVKKLYRRALTAFAKALERGVDG